MPTPAMAADVLLNVSAPGMPKVIANATEDGFTTGLQGALKAEQKEITTMMIAAKRDAVKVGRKKDAEALQAFHDRKLASINTLYRKQRAHEKALRGQLSDEEKKARQAALAHTKMLIERTQQSIKDETAKRVKADKKRLDQLEEGLKRAARSFDDKLEESLEGFGDKFESTLSQALSAENLDLGALIKGGGQSLKGAAPDLLAGGKRLSTFGAKQGGMMGKGAMMLGKAAAGLGAAAGVLAGAAAVLAGFVALLMAAYGQAKEFNKAILEGSSAVDLLGTEALGSAGALSNELENLRSAAVGVAFDFRTTTEEVLAMANAMNQAGFTYKEQVKTFGTYDDALRQSTITIQALGIGAGEYAESVNQMTRDFAYGQHAIAEGFSDIFGAAQMSGMGVKNFFTAVSEATSGMALYNFRLEDTLELMIGLEKLLGEDLSREVMGSLKGKYKGAGTQERFKAVMTAGGAGTQVLQTFMKAAEQGFITALSDASAESQRAVAARGGVEGMRTMSPKELAVLANEIQAAGDEALARKVLGLGRAQRGAAEGAGLGARAEALGELDQAGTMAFSMSQAYGVLGDQALTDLSGVTKMAFEEITGLSGETLTAYQDVFARAEARAAERGEATDFQSVIEGIQTGRLLSPEDEALLAEAQGKGMQTMEDIAMQQLAETTSILQTLKTGVVMMLETIYNKMTWFSDGGIREQRQARDDAQKALDEYKAGEDVDPEVTAELQARLKYEQAQYEGRLQGKGEDTVNQALFGNEKGLAMGLAYKVTARQQRQMTANNASRQGIASDPGVYTQGMVFTGEIKAKAQEATNEQLAELFGLNQKIGDQEKKSSKEQVRAVNRGTEEIKDLQEILREGGMSKLAELLDEQGFKGTLEDENAIKAYLQQGEGGLTNRERAAAIAAGISFDDFIYRGDGTRGTIHPINSADDFYGAKPGGAIANALNGRGVSINSIVVYESGDPKKTLAMIKQGVETAMRKA